MLTTLGVAEFKKAIGAEAIDVLVNPHTTKLFASGSNGVNYKVEQDIDFTKPMVWLVEDGNLDEACLINKRETAEVKITL